MNTTNDQTPVVGEPGTARVCPGCGAPVAAEASEGLCTRCLLAAASVPTDGPGGGGTRRRAEAPELARVQAAFPRLEVIELIGLGGMGAVFRARQPDLDRFVALKVLPEDLGRDPAFAERFLREARVLARLTHPNIVAVHDFGQSAGLCYVLMEYVDGVNLRQAMRAGRFTAAQALGLVPQLCAALQFAHDAGVMHRDVKPENILLDARGQVKLADFGIAKLLDAGARDPGLTVTGAAVGTPQYMAPEQIERPDAVDHRADIYSLGVVFYELLTGELPLGRFAPPSAKTPLDARVDEIVMRALAKERELRQQSAAELRTEVERMDRRAAEMPVAEAPLAEAPLWGESEATRRGLLAVLAASAAAMAMDCVAITKTLAAGEWSALLGEGREFLPHLPAYALVLAFGVMAWRKRGWWLGPLQSGTPAASRADRALLGAVWAQVGMWWWMLLVMYLPSWTNLFRLLAAPSGGGQPAGFILLYVAYVVGLPILVVGWVVRVMRRPVAGPWEPMPRDARRWAVILGWTGGISTLLAWASRDGEQPVALMGMGSAFLPVCLALWFRSPCWRAVGLVESAYGVLGSLVGMGVLASGLYTSRNAPLLSGSVTYEPPLVRPETLAGMLGWVVLLAVAFRVLHSPGVRRAIHGASASDAKPASIPA